VQENDRVPATDGDVTHHAVVDVYAATGMIVFGRNPVRHSIVPPAIAGPPQGTIELVASLDQRAAITRVQRQNGWLSSTARVPRRKSVAQALDCLSTASFCEYQNLMLPSSGARVRTLAIVLNVISSLTSLAMAGLGWIVTMIARIPVPEQQDYRVVAYGVALIATFSMAPVICVTASTKVARQDRRSSVLVSLAPAVLVAAAVVYFVWAGTYVPIR
jgi:hypothetical protein